MIRKTKSGRYEVWVYNPGIGKKQYVGTYSKRGPATEDGTAKHAERGAEETFQGNHRTHVGTIRAWAERWQREYPRPEATTNAYNNTNLKAFLAEFGDRRLDSITKAEANRVATQRPHVAKTVSAMYNDALRYLEGYITPNPFHRLLTEGKGRQDITPLTEQEVRRLGDLAIQEWGVLFGATMRAAILFAAWTGCRPGELAALRPDDLDFDEALVTIDWQRRPDGLALPKNKQRRQIVMPPVAADAVRGMPVRNMDWVFTTTAGRPFSKGNWGYYWRPVRSAFEHQLPSGHWLRRRLDVDPKDHLDLYELRHFCGSLLADRGCSALDISEQLGNTPEVCERVYIHPHKDRARARVAAAFAQPERSDRAETDAREGVA